MIFFGDNLLFLKTCNQNTDELVKDKIKGKVKLIYIDPPFGTSEDFSTKTGQLAYQDKAKGSDFIEFIRRGIKSAEIIISEAGKDMSRFPTADHFTAWCGIAPGNNESAGKRKHCN
jgi:16S rRNA G966 N2-methylase RsmD